MTTQVTPPVARAHHVPEAVYVLGAVLTVAGANVAAMRIWWTHTNGTATDAFVYLSGGLAVLLLLGVFVLTLRHRFARHAAIGVLAMSVVVDAVLIGYELSGTTVLAGI
jgi:hypothetical protein